MNKNKKLLFLSFIMVVFFMECTNTKSNNKEIKDSRPDLSNTDFVYIQDNHFEIRNELFFPIMLNYCLSFRNIDNEFVVCPHINYEKTGEFENNTIRENNEQIRGHFQLIKEMGFNSIRVTLDRFNEKQDTIFSIENNYEAILCGFQQLIDIAKEKELKVMVLLKAPFDKSLEDFTCQILERFSDNPVIFAYDFINEPLYFDTKANRTKEDAYNLQVIWKNMMKKYAPNQLFTIGFSEPIEVFVWDPSISPVDFICFHTYHPLRVKSEVYWYAKYTHKPIMIGETALPADGDSISYAEQSNFAKELSEYAIDCGVAGFGWWDFQEDLWSVFFEAMYTGILNHEGTTTTERGNYTILGTPKEVVNVIKNIKDYQSKDILERPINYFNNLGYNNFVIKGKILNATNTKPVEGAVIRGWTKAWIAWNTYSDEKGNFTLYSNEKFVHFEISAPGMTTIKFNKDMRYKNISNSFYDADNMPNKELEYQRIGYKSFLNQNAISVFDFDETKFNYAKFEADMKNIYLKPLDFFKITKLLLIH